MAVSIKFLHAADLHIDSPFKGLSDVPEQVFQTMRKSTFQAFDRLIDRAIEKEVDFILLVGDLFDEDKQSLKAQLHLRSGFERLQEQDIQVYLTYGNHDYIKGNAYPIEYPSNVHIFDSEEVSVFPFMKNNQTLAHIYGFSYVNREVQENKARQYKIKDRTVPYHIAMLHGSLHGDQNHDTYAPFRLEDLNEVPFDYWALGHIHKRQIIQEQPPVVYPGNIQGRHRHEQGEKGCYYVEITEGKTSLEFLPLQSVLFKEKKLVLQMEDTIPTIKEKIESEIKAKDLQFIYLTLVAEEIHEETLGLSERLADLIDMINESFLQRSDWQYIYDFKIEYKEVKAPVDSYFLKEINKAIEEIELYDIIKPLYNHPQARGQLNSFDEKQVISEAIDYITKEIAQKTR